MDRIKTTLVILAAAHLATALGAAEYNVRDFGAIGDGAAKETAAIQKAIDQAERDGGGTVFFPPGVYVAGSIYLKDNIDFYVGPGATLLASPDKEDYNAADVCPQNSTYAPESSFGAHFILCIERQNVTVRGPGRIDGNSQAFLLDKDGKHYQDQARVPWRPSQMLYFVESKNIRVTDIELYHAPYWSCFLYGCEQVAVRGAQISTEREPHTHNGDGIDIDASRFVTVSDCRINTADDSITLRAGIKRLKNKGPCEYITVTNCTLSTPCNAIRVGVGQGEIRHAVFSNLVIHDTRTAFNLFSNWSTSDPRGVDISDIRFENITVDCEDFIRAQFGFGNETAIKNVYFSGISGDVSRTSYLIGKEDRRLENFRFERLDLRLSGTNDFLTALDMDGLTFDRVSVVGPDPGTPPILRTGNVERFEADYPRLEIKPLSAEEIDALRKRGRY